MKDLTLLLVLFFFPTMTLALPQECVQKVPQIKTDKARKKVQHGQTWIWDKNGAWQSVLEWHQGNKTGTWLERYENGEKKSLEIYKSGKSIKIAEWYQNGQKKERDHNFDRLSEGRL